MAKILIIGAGNVGTAIAFACSFLPQKPEVYIYDINDEKQRAACLDLNDGNERTKIYNFTDMTGIDIVVNCAGCSMLLKNSRDDELQYSKEIVNFLKKILVGYEGIVINVSNPCDKVTALLAATLQRADGKLFGTGTALEMTRARNIDKLADCVIIGEHGERNFVVGDDSLDMQKVRNRVWEIIKGRGYTSFGIANIIYDILDTILSGRNKEMVLCCYHSDSGVYFSDICTLGTTGIQSIKTPKLTRKQQEKLTEIIKEINNYVLCQETA